MSYRGPDQRRIAQQRNSNQFKHAGHTATWRQYISASGGVDVAGFGDTPSYREQTVTALFRSTIGLILNQPEFQTPAGMTIDADFLVVTREKLNRQDELVWRGDTYRVESDNVPSQMDGTYLNIVKRGK